MTQEDLNALIQSVNDKDGKIGAISSSADFFYQKAKDAWEEWKATAVSPDLLEKLIKMDYDEICDSTESEIVEIRDKMFKLIAYCDSKARDKNKFNECPDRRTIFSHTNIRQGAWLKNLLRYKNGEEEPNSSIKNLIDYLENPYDNFPIMQEVHKGLIFSYFTGKSSDSGSSFVGEIKKIFSPFSQCENEINETAWIASVIYLLKDEWNPQIVEGIFAHNDLHKEDPWQENAVKESAGGYICLSWDKPVGSDIIRLLRKRVENGDTFDFYILGAHAQYKAKVHDISEEGEYDSKYIEWKEYNPVVWLWDNFKTYNNGKAKIVLLADGFEKLKSRIDTSCFKSYRKVNRHMVRQGEIMAYTRILTNNEIKTQKMIDQHIELLRSNKNLILTGAPGTGKTYLAKQMAKQMIETDDLENNEQYGFVQFHPSYDYTDFVEGLRPTKPDANGNIGFELREGVFKEFCGRALKNFHAKGDDNDKADKFVFVIDEINRGDISKIFGELFFSIDPGYRGAEKGRVNTQYQNLIEENDAFYGGFYVPENVYIIGTMNDIDRSVESFDFAMRRRFVWQEVTAGQSAENMGLSGGTKDRMKGLNDEIANTEGLNSSYQVGGAYFLDSEGKERNDYDDIWELRLKPLLSEYLRGMPDAKNTLEKLKNAYDGISGTTPNDGQ